MTVQTDPKTGLAIPQPKVLVDPNRVGLPRWKPQGIGHITYRCHTCGELIVKAYEVLFVDDTPGREHCSTFAPGRTTRATTTHHDWHMASQQYGD